MDKRLTRRNLRSALIASAVCLVMFGMSFVAAVIYVS
jgi:sugar phosphate permease